MAQHGRQRKAWSGTARPTAFYNGIVGMIGVTVVRRTVPLKRHRTAEPGAPLRTACVHPAVRSECNAGKMLKRFGQGTALSARLIEQPARIRP
jgi:hypothetical protein